MRHGLWVGVLAVCCSCVAAPAGRGFIDQRVPSVTIVTVDEATRQGLAGEPLELAFGPGRDGSELVVEFLQAAARAGATAVSSLEIHLVSSRTATPLDCMTRFGPEVEVRSRVDTVHTPARTEHDRRLRPVSRWVSRSRYECRTVSRPHTVTRTDYHYEYDYSSKRSRSVPRTRTTTEYRSEQECSYRPHSEYQTTYEYQTEERYIPPRTDYVPRHYSVWKLAESAPTCAPVAPDGSVQNRITGTIYRRPAPAPPPRSHPPR